ncbi:MAG: hypothetical protein HYW22_00370 [Candidatus Aenigmarchaeota archaeon]|nr:hypothetical protein [Candidatus Aenigmarchaeota archaeon]
MKLLNSTLREGVQHANVLFDLPEMFEVSGALLETGNAHYIEIHSYDGDNDTVKQMIDRFGKDRIITHHRSDPGDIQHRIGMGEGNTAMFLSISEAGRRSIGLSYDDTRRKIKSDITRAIDGGLVVAKYTLEHATSTDPEIILELAKIARDAGTKGIGVPDTKGISEPSTYGALLEYVMSGLGSELPVFVHLHDDLNLATANALAAYDVGKRLGGEVVLDSSVLGLGERCGEVKTEVLNVMLRVLRGEKLQTEDLYKIGKLVSQITGFHIESTHPVLGSGAYTDRAGTHSSKIIKERERGEDSPYSSYNPAIVGRRRSFNLSAYSGVSTIKDALESYGIVDADPEKLQQIRDAVVELAKRDRTDVGPLDFEKIAAEYLPVTVEQLVERRGTPEIATYFVFVNVDGSSRDVAREIRKRIRHADYIAETFGVYDIIVRIPVDKHEIGNMYVDRIRSTPGVTSTQTYMTSRVWKG